MERKEEKLHPVLENWIEKFIGFLGRFVFLSSKDRTELAFIFRNAFFFLGIILVMLLAVGIPTLFRYLHYLLNS